MRRSADQLADLDIDVVAAGAVIEVDDSWDVESDTLGQRTQVCNSEACLMIRSTMPTSMAQFFRGRPARTQRAVGTTA